MELYLLRHGVAEEGTSGMSDEDRALTPEGRKRLRETLRVAARAGVAPGLILSSPYLRAMQTAEIAVEELHYQGTVVRTPTLEPCGDPRAVWSELRAHGDERQVLLSSHNPLCASLAAYLLGTPELQVDYRKGALMRIDVERLGVNPRGVLRWFLTTKLAL